MNEVQVRTLEQVRQVLAGAQVMEYLAAAGDADRYSWIAEAHGLADERQADQIAAYEAAKLLKRMFKIDIAAILEQPVIEQILTHLGLQARAPPRVPARGSQLQAA